MNKYTNKHLQQICKKPRLSEQSLCPVTSSAEVRSFNGLNYDIFLRIFNKVDSVSQARLRRVCKKWNKILKSLQLRQVVTLDFPLLAPKGMSQHHHYRGTLVFSSVAFDQTYHDAFREAASKESIMEHCDLCLSLLNTILKPTNVIRIVNSGIGRVLAISPIEHTVFQSSSVKEKLCVGFWESLVKSTSTNFVLILENVAVRLHDLIRHIPGSYIQRVILRNVRICGISSQEWKRELCGFSVEVMQQTSVTVGTPEEFSANLWHLIDDLTIPLSDEEIAKLAEIQSRKAEPGHIFRSIIITREPDLDHPYFNWRKIEANQLKHSTGREVLTAYQPGSLLTMTQYYDRYDVITEDHRDFAFGVLERKS